MCAPRAATGRLLVGEADEAMRCARVGLLHGEGIRRVDRREKAQVPGERSSRQHLIERRQVEWIVVRSYLA